MTNKHEEHHDNLAKKISWREVSFLRALREYLASFAGVQKCSNSMLKAFQSAHDKTLDILNKTSENK